MKACNSNANYLVAEGYTQPKGHTVAASGYISNDTCGCRLPCGLCLMMEKPCPMMQQMAHSEVTCSTEVK